MKSNHIFEVLFPSIMLFAVHFFVIWLTDPYFSVGATIVSGAILEIMAYVSCLFLVLKKEQPAKDKPTKKVWNNYILWAVLFHIGTIYEFLQT